MFRAESDMTTPVVEWMESSGLTTRLEFISPWGICDIVGISFDETNVARRLKYGQRNPISSIVRATLLLRIPDIETESCISLKGLIEECSPFISHEVVENETKRLIKDGFVIAQSENSLQKLNGWMPLQQRLVAVELKLNRIEEALTQAKNNLGFADESYVALPEETALRIEKKNERLEDFQQAGVGLLAVNPKGCWSIIPSKPPRTQAYSALKLYSVDKFWRSHIKGS